MTNKTKANLSAFEKACLLSGKSTWETRAIPKIGLRSLFMADGPHGIRKQVGSADHLGINESLPATCFPPSASLANSWEPQLTEAVGEAVGKEARALQVDVVLGPGLNIKRSPLGGRNFEYYSEDPYLSGKLAAGFVRGLQSQQVAACPKHFAVNSQETLRMTSNSVVDEQTMREVYLTAFEIMVKDSDPWSIMSSYNLLNGTYTNENFELLTQILRNDWGFSGPVITDWGGGNDVFTAIHNGGNLEMPSPGFDSVRQIVTGLSDGQVSEDDLDNRSAEMIEFTKRIPQSAAGAIPVEKHHRLAQNAAEKSIVLLKNNKQLLPLPPQTKVAIIGDFAKTPRYQGAGSSMVNPTKLDSTLDVVGNFPLDLIGFSQGFRRDRSEAPDLVIEAARLAEKADVVLAYIGLDELSESEGQDRDTLEIPKNQITLLEALVNTGKPIVAVISAGSVISMPWINGCEAVIHGYLGGQAGAGAMLAAISGQINPQGRLAESYPHEISDTPCANYFPSLEKNAEYREGPFVGYRYYTSVGKKVLFPFGFGLSYTTFEYSDLKENPGLGPHGGISVKIDNTGPVHGYETVQLYSSRASDSPTGVIRPARKLIGFTKVSLEPGQSQVVNIPFDEYSFRHWDTSSGCWEIESGDFLIEAGSNSIDLPQKIKMSVSGTVSPSPELLQTLPHYSSGQIQEVGIEEFQQLVSMQSAFLPWPEVGPLHLNSSVGQMIDSRSPVARFVARRMYDQLEKSKAKGKPDLNLLFLTSMPFRAISKMSNGMADLAMVDSILTIVNGYFFKGFGSLIGRYFANTRNQKHMKRKFEEISTQLEEED